MSPRDLTDAEARWVARLRRTLAACPPTLELLTIGGYNLDVIDAAKAHLALHDGSAERVGALLDTVRSPVPIHGVSG